ncbi:MAG: alpha-ketoglutarate-dependent dioxygenase AlkB [Nostocaceae cyanobacterium]|nr:alpha-ketoglutarate-dependent dioxygenase AlkB [Nostocaceae cyanobacterium]
MNLKSTNVKFVYSLAESGEIGGVVEYVPDFITPAEHHGLLEQIDRQPWLTILKRRVQHYGYMYSYKRRTVDTSMHLGELPVWADEIARRLYKERFIKALPDQVIVNEYQPGQGIAKHIDCLSCFTDTIISLSLGSTCVMDFIHQTKGVKKSILLEPRSLTILRDEARYEWLHGIATRKSDRYQDQLLIRRRRVSLTFRKVILL